MSFNLPDFSCGASKKTHITVGIRTVGNRDSSNQVQETKKSVEQNLNLNPKYGIRFNQGDNRNRGWSC